RCGPAPRLEQCTRLRRGWCAAGPCGSGSRSGTGGAAAFLAGFWLLLERPRPFSSDKPCAKIYKYGTHITAKEMILRCIFVRAFTLARRRLLWFLSRSLAGL